MNLVPKISPRERILLMGGPGTGKSNAVLAWARKCTGIKFYVIDNDMSYDRLLATDYQDVESAGNVVLHNVMSDDWDGHMDATRQIQKEMSRDDVAVLDMSTETWQAVQSWFTMKIHGEDIADYFLATREGLAASKKNLTPFEGFVDWPVINKQYARFQTLWLNMPGHMVWTSEVAATSSDDEGSIKNTFGAYGVKPKGQKRTGHIFSTILLFTKTRVGEYKLTTIKDRGRVELEDAGIEDFARDYLMRVAKWRPGAAS